MWIIMGLGNPGARYVGTRHNVGFVAVDALAARWHIPFATQGDVRIGVGTVAGAPAVLAEPQTYMNRSGDVLASLTRNPGDELIVVYDELDLAPGQVRVRPRGGSGGHRGVSSIAARVGEEFVRVRIGIGRPGGTRDAAEHVLEPFLPEEQSTVRAAIERACDAVECVLTRGTAAAMNAFNGLAAAGTAMPTTKE